MSQKILVAFATRAGSTSEVSQIIGDALAEMGAEVDVMPISKVSSLDGYQAFVLGSAVRVGQWLPEAVKFVELHRPVLSQHPVALFAVHIMNLEDDDASRKARLAYLDPVRKLITPRAEAFFAGVGDLTKLNFVERMLGKMAKAPEGDFRDPQAIRAWGMSLYDLLV